MNQEDALGGVYAILCIGLWMEGGRKQEMVTDCQDLQNSFERVDFWNMRVKLNLGN